MHGITRLKKSIDWVRVVNLMYGKFSLQVEFFENAQKTEVEQALNMLQIWAEDDEDASPENLSYTLEGLGLLEAAYALKEVTEVTNVQ